MLYTNNTISNSKDLNNFLNCSSFDWFSIGHSEPPLQKMSSTIEEAEYDARTRTRQTSPRTRRPRPETSCSAVPGQAVVEAVDTHIRFEWSSRTWSRFLRRLRSDLRRLKNGLLMRSMGRLSVEASVLDANMPKIFSLATGLRKLSGQTRADNTRGSFSTYFSILMAHLRLETSSPHRQDNVKAVAWCKESQDPGGRHLTPGQPRMEEGRGEGLSLP